jgi:predicted ArsR family transcriptional regulator
LSLYGYEPRVEDEVLVMGNCPFQALTATHPRLVCEMSHGLLDGACDAVGGLTRRWSRARGRCCVVLKEAS